MASPATAISISSDDEGSVADEAPAVSERETVWTVIERRGNVPTKLSMGPLFNPYIIDPHLPIDPRLTTTAYPGIEMNWSENNLPFILFYLHTLRPLYRPLPLRKLLENGHEVTGADGIRTITHFPYLPRYVACDVPAWLVETWYRYDSRITPADIIDRQCRHQDPETMSKAICALNERSIRDCRKPLGLLPNDSDIEVTPRYFIEIIEGLNMNNIKRNTILNPSSIARGWLSKVSLGSDGRGGFYKYVLAFEPRNISQTATDWTAFLAYRKTAPAVMKPMVRGAELLLYLLQQRASIHGLAHWSELDDCCLPPSWNTTATDDNNKDNTSNSAEDRMDIDVNEDTAMNEASTAPQDDDIESSHYDAHGGCPECLADPDRDLLRDATIHRDATVHQDYSNELRRDQEGNGGADSSQTVSESDESSTAPDHDDSGDFAP